MLNFHLTKKSRGRSATGWDFIPPSRLWPASIRTKQSSSRVICPWVSARNDEPTDWFYSFLSKSSWSFAHFWAKVPGFSQNWENGCLKNLRPLQIWRNGSLKLRKVATSAKMSGFKDGVTKRDPSQQARNPRCTLRYRALSERSWNATFAIITSWWVCPKVYATRHLCRDAAYRTWGQNGLESCSSSLRTSSREPPQKWGRYDSAGMRKSNGTLRLINDNKW